MSTLETAINAIVAKSPDAGQKIEMAAMHMGGTAQVLAKGIAAVQGHLRQGDRGGFLAAGQPDRAARPARGGDGVRRADRRGGQGNLNDPEVKGAVAALSSNTNQLGDAIGSVYGQAAQARVPEAVAGGGRTSASSWITRWAWLWS